MVAPERDPFEPLPPHSIEAEEACLGGLLAAPEQIASIAQYLRPEHFFRPEHATVYDAILRVHGRGTAVDFVTVGAELDAGRVLGAARTSQLMAGFVAYTPRGGLTRAEEYAFIVWKTALYRALIPVGAQIVKWAYANEPDPERVMRQCEAALLAVTKGALAAGEPAHPRSLVIPHL